MKDLKLRLEESLEREHELERILEDLSNDVVALCHSSKSALSQISKFLENTHSPIIINCLITFYNFKKTNFEEELSDICSLAIDEEFTEDDKQKSLESLRSDIRFMEDRLRSIEVVKGEGIPSLTSYDPHIKNLIYGNNRELASFLSENYEKDLFLGIGQVLDEKRFKGLVNHTFTHIEFLKKLENGSISLLDKTESVRANNYRESKIERFELLESLEKVTRSLSEALKDRGLNLSMAFDTTEVWVVGKKNVLEREILRNCFYNAIRFSPLNSNIECVVSAENCLGVIKVFIKDFGPGITTGVKEKLFKETVTSQEGLNGEVGSGVGLKTAKSLLKLWDGDISINSQCGENSFTEVVVTLKISEIDMKEEIEKFDFEEWKDDS